MLRLPRGPWTSPEDPGPSEFGSSFGGEAGFSSLQVLGLTFSRGAPSVVCGVGFFVLCMVLIPQVTFLV